LTLLVTATSTRAVQAQTTGTLALDAQSFISYSDTLDASLPPGSTIRFRFGEADADGSIPLTIAPEDVSIAPVAVAEGTTIEYALAEPAHGTLRRAGSARQIELVATLVARQRESTESAPVAYRLRFTTGMAEASNAAQTESVEVEGAPAAASNQVRLVGAATNDPDAFPAPGEAVYAVLSGTFDALPEPP
jgi:hypothetical protein